MNCSLEHTLWHKHYSDILRINQEIVLIKMNSVYHEYTMKSVMASHAVQFGETLWLREVRPGVSTLRSLHSTVLRKCLYIIFGTEKYIRVYDNNRYCSFDSTMRDSTRQFGVTSRSSKVFKQCIMRHENRFSCNS